MRKITSIIVAITFVIVSISGIQMVFTSKPQSVPQQISGNLDGDKSTTMREKPFYPKKAHEWAGFIFIGAGLMHIGFNRRPMLSYLKVKKK